MIRLGKVKPRTCLILYIFVSMKLSAAGPFDRYRHLVFIVVGLVSFYFTDNRASVSTHYSRNLGRVEPLHFEV